VASPLPGCAVLPGASVSDEERQAFADAEALLRADPVEGERRLADAVERFPESRLAGGAARALGQRALARGDAPAALAWLHTALRREPEAAGSDALRVRVAELELGRGDAEAAQRVLARARFERLDAADRLAGYRVLADAARDPVGKLLWVARLRGAQEDEDAVALNDVEIDALIAQLSPAELTRAAEQLGDHVPAARVWLAIASRALDAGDVERAREAVGRATAAPLDEAYAGRLSAARERLRRAEEGPGDLGELPRLEELAQRGAPPVAAARGTLGVVLPLSGHLASFGEDVLHGVLLAAGVFDAQAIPGAGPEVGVVVRDSAGRPDRAAEAVRELARDPRVGAIVGPLLSGECEAAAGAAEAEGVPLLTLTPREEVARDRSFVFRLRSEPAEETQLLVEHAMNGLGARRFAILYPRDRYGRGLRTLFWEEVERRGGEIVGVASYDPEATDFAGPIRQLVGYALLTEGEKAALAQRERITSRARRLPPREARALMEEARAITGPGGVPLPPIVDFDALFIPESHEKVGLIAPQLAYHEAVGMRLLGVSGWYGKDLLRIAQEHVEGARFTVPFYPESELAVVQDFRDRYAATFHAEPEALAAQAYDAARLVLVQLAAGRVTREAIRDGLLATRGYPGVSGVLSMRPDGNARKRPFLLAVESGRIRQLE
jgi:ABC-type branched-subunit amino acid transport system substrate-binding protein